MRNTFLLNFASYNTFFIERSGFTISLNLIEKKIFRNSGEWIELLHPPPKDARKSSSFSRLEETK